MASVFGQGIKVGTFTATVLVWEKTVEIQEADKIHSASVDSLSNGNTKST